MFGAEIKNVTSRVYAGGVGGVREVRGEGELSVFIHFWQFRLIFGFFCKKMGLKTAQTEHICGQANILVSK